MTQEEFRIQKTSVPVSCTTVRGEKVVGEIYVDMLTIEGYTVKQVLDFFNASLHFFPIKARDHSRPILLSRQSIVKVELPGMLERFLEETSTTFAQKKEAVMHVEKLGIVRTTLIVDLPSEHSRLMDFLSAPTPFFAAVIDKALCLLNQHHIYKIEEL